VSFHVACAQQQSKAPLITQDCHIPLHVLNIETYSVYTYFSFVTQHSELGLTESVLWVTFMSNIIIEKLNYYRIIWILHCVEDIKFTDSSEVL